MMLVNVAAENFHRTHTNAKGEEGLIHGGRDNGPPTMLINTVKAWQKQEGKKMYCGKCGAKIEAEVGVIDILVNNAGFGISGAVEFTDALKEELRADLKSEKVQAGSDEARVVAHLWNKGKESVLEYKMSLVNGNWKAWDLVIDDLSTARNYKEQFGQILKTKSFAELIDIISKKADEAEK